jgi:hypothetical protein
MGDDEVRELLHEVADGVEPGDRLDAIRAATSPRHVGRGWWVAGGVGLVAASVVTALALTTGGAPRTTAPGPAEPSPTPTRSAAPTPPVADPSERIDDLEELRRFADGVRAVYYIGDTPSGPRLFREFLTMDGDNALSVAVAAAVGRTRDGRSLPPEDPDYRVVWPALTNASAEVSSIGDVIEVSLGGDPERDLRSRGDLTAEEAQLAIEALVRTAQAAVGERLPVRFLLFGDPVDTLLGVPTSEPVAAGSDLDVLAHVSLSDPFEGQVVDNDEPFVVRGAANSFEGNVVTRIQRWEGTEVVAEEPTIAGWDEDRLFPFEVTFDLSDVPPGDYVVMSRTDDPSGAGMFDTDTRRITVID